MSNSVDRFTDVIIVTEKAKKPTGSSNLEFVSRIMSTAEVSSYIMHSNILDGSHSALSTVIFAVQGFLERARCSLLSRYKKFMNVFDIQAKYRRN